MTRKTKKTDKVVKTYEPSERERAAIEASRERSRARRPLPKLKLAEDKNGNDTIIFDHENSGIASRLALGVVGSGNYDFLAGYLGSLADATDAGGNGSVEPMNFVMGFVQGVEPRDEIEALLAAQMAITHRLMMVRARRLANAERVDHVEVAGRIFNQLGRTFTAQVEALKRYRTGGEQKVRVEHVTVNDGGQAIVGNVETGGRGNAKK